MFLTHTIETDGHKIAGRRPFVTPGRFFCLLFTLYSTHYYPPSLQFLSPSSNLPCISLSNAILIPCSHIHLLDSSSALRSTHFSSTSTHLAFSLHIQYMFHQTSAPATKLFPSSFPSASSPYSLAM